MTRKSFVCSLVLLILSFIIVHVYGESFHVRKVSDGSHHETIRRLQSLKASLTRHDSIASTPSSSFSPSPSPSSQPSEVNSIMHNIELWFLFSCRTSTVFEGVQDGPLHICAGLRKQF